MKLRQRMYKKKSFLDVIVMIISLAALVTLIFVLKHTNDRSRTEQEMLTNAEGQYQWVKSDIPLYDMIEYLVINEVNQAGWIELYNRSMNTSIELSNCYIAINGEKQYSFGEMDIIRGGEFLCIEDLGILGSLDNDIIAICDENGSNLKSILLPSLGREESYGCLREGDIQYSYLTASKGLSNIKSERIEKDQLIFSVPGGFYNESFALEITAAKDSTIYYTLDGTKPTNQSEVYTEPILIENRSGSNMQYALIEGIDYIGTYRPTSISMGMVVRAMAVDDRLGISSEEKTQSYFIGMKNAGDLRNIPIISITVTPDYLFDYFTGIYVSGRSREDALVRGEDGKEAANYLNNWRRKVYVEYFEPQKDKTYEGEMSISIINDFSIYHPQKSLMLTAKGGAFSGSGLEQYYNNIGNRLIVQTNRMDNKFKIREYLAGRLLENTSVGTPDLMPCNVFINGEYWGGYMLRSEYDQAYIHKHYGIEETNVLIARDYKITNATEYQEELTELLGFILNKDLSKAENYDWVASNIDIQSYIEYFCANMYLANAEYGREHLTMWRTINKQGKDYADGKWRFLMPNIDNSMKNVEAGKVATSSINTFLQAGVTKDVLFQSLLRNDVFKEQLSSVMSEMVEECFNFVQVEKELSVISLQMKRMVENSYRRHYGYVSDFFYVTELDRIRSFFQERSRFILVYTEEVMSWGGMIDVSDDAISE